MRNKEEGWMIMTEPDHIAKSDHHVELIIPEQRLKELRDTLFILERVGGLMPEDTLHLVGMAVLEAVKTGKVMKILPKKSRKK